MSFDPGIGQGEAIDPGLASMLGSMQQAKQEQDRVALAQPVPAPVPVPQAPAPVQATAAAPQVDEYRLKNPSLASISFKDAPPLPSGAKPYPANASIRFRPYTFGEAIYVEQSNLTMRETYAMILKGIECNFDPMKLTLPDVLYLGLLRKMSALGDTKVNVTTSCPYCKGLNRTPIEASKLEFDDLGVPALPVRVKLSFGELAFSPITLGRYLDLLDRGLEDDFPALMAAQCISISDLDQAIETIRNLTHAKDIALIKKVDDLLHHELRPVRIVCPQPLNHELEEGDESPTCGKAYPASLDDVSAAFVLPFPGTEDEYSDQIAFG